LDGVPWWQLLFLSSAWGNLCSDQCCRQATNKLPCKAKINLHIYKLRDPFLQELFTPQGRLVWPDAAPLDLNRDRAPQQKDHLVLYVKILSFPAKLRP